MPRPDGTSVLLETNVVSSNFFQALGVKPIVGRAFTPADAATLRTHPGVLLGYGFWQREFAGDPNIAGRQITLLRGKDHRNKVDIWGVLPPQFREIDNGMDRDLWMPAETWAVIAHPGELTSREFRWFYVLGRLADGASVAQVNDQVSAIAKGWRAADPAINHDRDARAVSDFRYRMHDAGTSGLVLLAIVAAVVLLATVNVAHLLLARALARNPEVALRLALGARRATLARQLLTENVLLCVLSLGAGLALADGITALLPRLMVNEPAMLVQVGSSGAGFQIDWRVFSFACVMALGTMLLLALVPLHQVSRPELLPAVQASTVTRTETRVPMTRRAAIWLQVAISFALLVSTGALVRSFLNTRTQSIGLTRNQVLLAWTQDPEPEMRQEIVNRLSAIPGVERVVYAIRSPLSLSEGGIAVKALLPSHPELHDPVDIKFNAVSPGFLDVIGTRVIRGRGFTAADDQNGPPVVLINQAMAGKYWPGQNPLGQVVKLSGTLHGADQAQVIGVTENAAMNRIGEIPEPYLYLPFHFSDMGEVTFALQTGVNAMSLARPARDALIHIHPLLDPMMVTSLPELIRYSAREYQVMAELVTALGLIGLALTVVGLYGFLAFRVTQRRREIGIRMALGADRAVVAREVMMTDAKSGLLGIGLGVLVSVEASRVLGRFLVGVPALDPVSYGVAACVLVAAAMLAALVPARRASATEPMVALRTE
jgi:predicted permease